MQEYCLNEGTKMKIHSQIAPNGLPEVQCHRHLKHIVFLELFTGRKTCSKPFNNEIQK